jgi:Tol biopolymer transport system component
VGLAGGPARRVLSCVRGGRGFAAAVQGIYYIACDPTPDPPIRLVEVDTGRDRVVPTPEQIESEDRDFSVSPDGRTILYAKRGASIADLVLIENFK